MLCMCRRMQARSTACVGDSDVAACVGSQDGELLTDACMSATMDLVQPDAAVKDGLFNAITESKSLCGAATASVRSSSPTRVAEQFKQPASCLARYACAASNRHLKSIIWPPLCEKNGPRLMTRLCMFAGPSVHCPACVAKCVHPHA
jgi:hypothetical protein